jgi:hypothetical protein
VEDRIGKEECAEASDMTDIHGFHRISGVFTLYDALPPQRVFFRISVG